MTDAKTMSISLTVIKGTFTLKNDGTVYLQLWTRESLSKETFNNLPNRHIEVTFSGELPKID